jgi:hypothetical protein
MSRRIFFMIVCAFSVMLGVALAGLWPSDASAVSRTFWFGIPVREDNDWAQLTCGWHGGACSNNPGVALDWDEYPSPLNHKIYVRGEGYSPAHSFPSGLAYAIPRADGTITSCQYNVVLDVYETGTNAWLVSLVYTHARHPGWGTYLYFNNSIPAYWNPGVQVAEMATTADPRGCAWRGVHVHAWHWCCSPAGVFINQGYPTGTISPTQYWNRDINNWTRGFSW